MGASPDIDFGDPRIGYLSLVGAPEGVSPGDRIAGLPLVVRLARQMERGGARRLCLVTDDSEARWSGVLAAYGVGRTSPVVAVSPGEVPSSVGQFVATAIYGTQDVAGYFQSGGDVPPPRVRVRDAASVRLAEASVWGAIRKSVSHDGPVAWRDPCPPGSVGCC